jgi:hypothetical protein
MKLLPALALGAFVLLGVNAFAATYYVDYSNGSDSNNGTSKSTPWKYAPGMYGCANTCNSTKLNPGDSVILKGCVTWHNAAFPWQTKFNGSSGNPIYYGVDQTWWDSTVPSCAAAWNRPILNPDATDFSHNNTYLERLVYLGNNSYQTIDNFEVTNVLHNDGYLNDEVTTFDFGSGDPNNNNIVQNCYVHGWINPYFSIGTGNIAANSGTITNFIPYSYSGSPASGWATLHSPVAVQVYSKGSNYWPIQNNGPIATSITGTNPYTIVTNSSTVGSGCTECVVQIGNDYGDIFAGVEGSCTGCIAQNNVIDGSDTAQAQLNPYGDCGASEGNNQWCVSSATAGWRLPNIWRNNVIQYVGSAFVGECSEWSGNLIQYMRFTINPTAHTNGIECLDEHPVNGVTLSYNNVIRHTNNPNPNIPGIGQWSIGLFNQYTPVAGSTEYVFNNVVYDTLQNVWAGLFPGGNGCCGSVVIFNNTSNCGPDWSLSYGCSNSCPSGYMGCKWQNNQWITTASSGCNGCTETTDMLQTPSAATGQGYLESSTYAYYPASGGSTIGAGTTISGICTAITTANAAAGSACSSSTAYGATYNTYNHTASVGPLTPPTGRPSTPNIGAYQFGSSIVVAPPSALTVTNVQ